jgi:transcriptional regulator with XRE-family HTH domain
MSQPRRPIGRRQLGSELRRLRIDAGKAQRDLAAIIECDSSQISKVEKGERALKVLELTALLDFLGVGAAKRREIVALGQEARKRQPRHLYSDVLPGTFRRLGDLEEDATEIFYSSGELIPGLLQVPDYVRALVRNAIFRKHLSAEDEIEARVTFRLDRQKLLNRENAPPHSGSPVGLRTSSTRQPCSAEGYMWTTRTKLRSASARTTSCAPVRSARNHRATSSPDA